MSRTRGRALGGYRLDALPQRPEKVRVLEADRVGSSGARAWLRLARSLSVLTLSSLLVLSARPAAAEPPVPSTPAPASAPSASVPLLAFVFGAIGLSGLSVGGTTGFLAMNQKAIAEDHCSSTVQLCDGQGRAANDTGRTLRDISTAGFIVGGLGVGLSAYFLLTRPAAHDGDVAVAVVVDAAQPRAALVTHF